MKTDNNRNIEQLEATFLHHYLTHRDLQKLFERNQNVSFQKNELILKQGKIANGIYLVLSGTVEVRARIMGEGNTKIGTLSPGEFLGEISFIEKGPSTTSAIAKTEVDCLWITPTFLNLLCSYYPQLRYKILQALTNQICRRLKLTHDKVKAEISGTGMISQSFFGKVIYSLTQPREINKKDVEAYTLPTTNFFALLTPIEIEYLFEHVTFYDAPKNCVLIHEGQKTASCFVMIQGAVQSSITHNNKIAKLSVIGPGSLFAGIACVDNNSEFTITFTTCEPAILVRIDEKKLAFLKNEKKELWYKIFELITTSLVALRKSIDKLDIRLHIEKYNR